MSARRSGKSHSIVWTVAIFIGVPVLYLLSVPIVANLSLRTPSAGSPYITGPRPRWLELYVIPSEWVYEHAPPLRQPMREYAMWVARALG